MLAWLSALPSALEPRHLDYRAVALVVQVSGQRDRRIGGVLELGQAHLPEAVVKAPLHGAHDEMRAAVGGPGPRDLLGAVLAGHIHQVLQADALARLAVTLHAREVGLPAAPEEEVFPGLVHLAFPGIDRKSVV